jgi:hypothetical protein
MSAPHVTGVIALMLQANPSLDPSQVDAIIRQTARHDRFTGSASWTPDYGAGKVDALAAVQRVLGIDTGPPSTPKPLPTSCTGSSCGPPIQLVFSLLSVRVEKSGSKADFQLARAPLTRTQVGRKVDLSIYVRIQSVPDDTPLLVEWTVTHGSTCTGSSCTVGYNKLQETLNHGDAGEYRDPWTFTPRFAGTYTFNARVTVNGRFRQGKAVFSAQKR